MKRLVAGVCVGLILLCASAVLAQEEEEEDEPEITAAQARTFYRKEAPWVIAELDMIAAEEPAEYEEVLQEWIEWFAEQRDLERRSREGAALRLETLKLHGQIQEAIGQIEQRRTPQRVARLRALLAKVFDAETALGVIEVGMLEEELHQMRQEVAERMRERRELIERELDEILGDIDDEEDDEDEPEGDEEQEEDDE